MIQLPREPAGTSKLSAWLKQLLQYTRSCEIKSGPGYRVRKSNAGTILDLDLKAVASSGYQVYVAEVQSWSSDADYFAAKLASYNESTDSWETTGDSFYVALPHLLRQDAKPSSSHATAEAVVWPPYADGDIVVICTPLGGTGVEVSGTELEEIALNDGRMWCFQVTICTTEQTYYAIVPLYALTTSENEAFVSVE